jgi:hypothetical protein
MEIFHRQKFGLALFQPLGSGQRLTLGAMPVRARNGDLSRVVLEAEDRARVLGVSSPHRHKDAPDRTHPKEKAVRLTPKASSATL